MPQPEVCRQDLPVEVWLQWMYARAALNPEDKSSPETQRYSEAGIGQRHSKARTYHLLGNRTDRGP